MSWIIVNKETGKSVCELTNINNVKRINTKKYKALTALDYLTRLNREIKTQAA